MTKIETLVETETNANRRMDKRKKNKPIDRNE